MVDITEVLRGLSSFKRVYIDYTKITLKNKKQITIDCGKDDIIKIICDTYSFYKMLKFITVTRPYRNSDKILIIVRTPTYSCPLVKRPRNIRKVTVSQSIEDDDPRAAPLVGALRWGLEKYVLAQFLEFSKDSVETIYQLIGMWLCDRGVEVSHGSDKQSCDYPKEIANRFTRYYPPYLVFGRGSGLLGETSYGSSARVVSVSCDKHGRVNKVEVDISPPPVVYKAFLDLGRSPNEVKEAVASLLAVAVSMLNPQVAFCGEAPVPLTAQIGGSMYQKVVMKTSYAVSKERADEVILASWERIFGKRFKK